MSLDWHPAYACALGGARFLPVKVRNPPGSEKDTVEGKGVYREVKSEGSRMWEYINHGQTSGLTNGNRMKGYTLG